jgi:hypothetical protein
MHFNRLVYLQMHVTVLLCHNMLAQVVQLYFTTNLTNILCKFKYVLKIILLCFPANFLNPSLLFS